MIDELARLAKMECFEELLNLLERCTEETRKANITFFGSSPNGQRAISEDAPIFAAA